MNRILVVIAMLVASVGFSAPDKPIELDFNSSETDFLKKRKKSLLNRRVKYPAGFNIYGAGPSGLVGLSFDYFLTPKVALEIGGGVRNFTPDVGFFAGGRYHLFGKTPLNITPYVGIYSGFEYTGSDIRNFNLYVPVGIQRIKKNKVAWSIEIAYQRNSYHPGKNIYGGGKLGFRF